MTALKLTQLTKKVLKVIVEAKTPLRPIDIHQILGSEMKIRSIRYAIGVLEEQNLIERRPDLADLRSFYIYSKRPSIDQ